MTTPKNVDRRQFLQYSLFGATLAAFPGVLLAESSQIKTSPTPGFNADVELEFTAQDAFISIFDEGKKTKVQKYFAKLLKGPKDTLTQLHDTHLGPIVHFVKGQKVRVYFTNELTEPHIIHWHGLHVPQSSDGHPMYTIDPGEKFVYEFEVLNRAGTSFYHSHAHHLTAEQVYRGLAGLITVSDEDEKALDLPRGEYDVPFAIQDRTFDDNNQLQYLNGMMMGKMMGFLGDTILVNGKKDAEFAVKTRAYRFRALNGSSSRIYKLGWEDGTPLTAIGTDACLLEKPETRPYIMLAPGERVDLWLDFTGREVGSKLVMFSLPHSGTMPAMYEKMHKGGKHAESGGEQHRGMGMMGGMQHGGDNKAEAGEHQGMGMGGMHGGGMQGGGMSMMNGLAQGAKFVLATFKVTEKVSDSPKLPAKLVTFQRLTAADTDNAGQPIPIAISEGPMAMRLNTKPFSMDEVMDIEKVKLGSIKKIKIFHAHGGEQKMEHGDKAESKSGSAGEMTGMQHSGDKKPEASGQAGGMMGGMGGGMMMTMAHPIHLHGQQYQILSRKISSMGSPGYETVKDGFIDTGWKDTVLVMPGEEVEIVKPFQDYKGLFLYHCHNLEHEGMDMMRQFYIS